MPFRIAIPSYKRAQTLRKKTLTCLEREGVPLEWVEVFVASEAERDLYREVCGDRIQIHVGVPGIHRQRQFIHDFYEEGERVFCMDDDIRALRRCKEWAGVPLMDLLVRFFNLAEEEGCRLWGIYPTDHGLQLKPRGVVGLRYCIGSCFGMKNWKGTEYPYPTTEDFVRTLEAYRLDGRVLRFEGVGPTTTYFKEPGGLQEYRTAERQDAEMTALVNEYPALVVPRYREGRYSDVRFKVKTEKVIVIVP